jgi:hypothetical protein
LSTDHHDQVVSAQTSLAPAIVIGSSPR